MSDTPKYKFTTEENIQYLLLPVEVSPKGIKTIVIDLDEYEIVETGTKVKNGLPIAYQKFKLMERKTK